MLRQSRGLQDLANVAYDGVIGDVKDVYFDDLCIICLRCCAQPTTRDVRASQLRVCAGRHMTLGRNLSWLVLGIVLSTNVHADGANIAQKGTGSAAACQSCHGVAGEGIAAAGFPRLAGLGASYLQRQLEAFAEGTRSNAVMMPIAKALSAADRKAVASHYAAMPFGATAAMSALAAASWGASAPKVSEAGTAATAASAQAPAVGATLATRGRWSDTLPACEQCHGTGGGGVGADFPPLVGQSAAYLAAQLTAFKSKARPGGPMNLMAVVAQKLSEAEVRAVADYYATLPAGGVR